MAWLSTSQIYLTSTPGSETDNEAIVRCGSNTTQIVRTGLAAPDGNGTCSYLDYPVLSSNGQVAFWAQLTGTSGGSNDNSGLFRSSGATLVQLARTSQAAPDGNGQFSWLYEPAINASGQAGFYADLTNTSGGSADDAGIYLADGTRIAQVARDGQLLGDATINRLTFSSLAGQSGLNDEGAVAYWASLTHGKEVVSLPSFGNFRVMDRKATKARNPQTGAQFDVAASKRMKFTASKTLRAFLNGVTRPTETK